MFSFPKEEEMLMLLLKVRKKKKVFLVLYYRITDLKWPDCLIQKIPSRSKMKNSPDFKSDESISNGGGGKESKEIKMCYMEEGRRAAGKQFHQTILLLIMSGLSQHF